VEDGAKVKNILRLRPFCISSRKLKKQTKMENAEELIFVMIRLIA